MGRLTDKRRLFIEAYLTCFNASEAARQAGYRKPGSYGHYLKNLEIVKQAISKRLDDMAMSADEVLYRLGQQARGDISLFIKDGGAIDFDMVKAHGHLIKRVSHTPGKNSSVELHGAQSALALIGKHHKLFTDRIEHSGTVDIGLDDAAERFDKYISRLIVARAADADQEG